MKTEGGPGRSRGKASGSAATEFDRARTTAIRVRFPDRSPSFMVQGSKYPAEARSWELPTSSNSSTKSSSSQRPSTPHGGHRAHARLEPPAGTGQCVAMAEAATFTGFDRSAMQFWHELAAEMSREWFAENKQRYEALWQAPM